MRAVQPPDAKNEQRSASLWARGPKRAVDFLAGAAILLVLSPVLLIALALVKLTSPGPVFFAQERTGRGGRPFRLLKLRTMRAGRQPNPRELVPLDHPEITPVGRLLRRLKIDELPQILSVIRGDMALVGPRPTLPDQTRAYDAFQRRRLLVRPGLTGLAQVNGNAAISWDERIRYDVCYVKRHGLWMDLAILAKTALVIALGERRFARPFADSPYARRDPTLLADTSHARAHATTEPRAPASAATEPRAPASAATEPQAPASAATEPRAPASASADPQTPSIVPGVPSNTADPAEDPAP